MLTPLVPGQLLTEEQFRAGYPEFKGQEMLSIIAFHLAQAAMEIDPEVWLSKTSTGHGLLTAHKLCQSPSGKTAKMVANDGTTTYGRMYDKLVKQVAGKARPLT